jgi:hypothetical protein
MHGSTSSLAALEANSTPLTLHTTGPAGDLTTVFHLGGGGSTGTFHFGSAGTLTVTHTKGVTSQHSDVATCSFTETNHGTYTVLGKQSTGRFKDATGHGTFNVVFKVTFQQTQTGGSSLRETSDGDGLAKGAGNAAEQCNPNPNSTPASGSVTFKVSGPMTVQGSY